MKLIRNKICILNILFLTFVIPLSGQSDYHLYFQGKLIDIEGASIKNDHFDLKLTLKEKGGQELRSGDAAPQSTDQDGWFEFVIKEISGFLLKNGDKVQPVILELEFSPNKRTVWIGQQEDFMVSYTLTPILEKDRLEMEISRLEGSKLIAHSEENLLVFKDQSPFGYLTGGFLITTQDPVDIQLIEDLKIWIAPNEVTEPDTSSRGVKGGFPTGGNYRKKK